MSGAAVSPTDHNRRRPTLDTGHLPLAATGGGVEPLRLPVLSQHPPLPLPPQQQSPLPLPLQYLPFSVVNDGASSDFGGLSLQTPMQMTVAPPLTTARPMLDVLLPGVIGDDDSGDEEASNSKGGDERAGGKESPLLCMHSAIEEGGPLMGGKPSAMPIRIATSGSQHHCVVTSPQHPSNGGTLGAAERSHEEELAVSLEVPQLATVIDAGHPDCSRESGGGGGGASSGSGGGILLLVSPRHQHNAQQPLLLSSSSSRSPSRQSSSYKGFDASSSLAGGEGPAADSSGHNKQRRRRGLGAGEPGSPTLVELAQTALGGGGGTDGQGHRLSADSGAGTAGGGGGSGGNRRGSASFAVNVPISSPTASLGHGAHQPRVSHGLDGAAGQQQRYNHDPYRCGGGFIGIGSATNDLVLSGGFGAMLCSNTEFDESVDESQVIGGTPRRWRAAAGGGEAAVTAPSTLARRFIGHPHHNEPPPRGGGLHAGGAHHQPPASGGGAHHRGRAAVAHQHSTSPHSRGNTHLAPFLGEGGGRARGGSLQSRSSSNDSNVSGGSGGGGVLLAGGVVGPIYGSLGFSSSSSFVPPALRGPAMAHDSLLLGGAASPQTDAQRAVLNFYNQQSNQRSNNNANPQNQRHGTGAAPMLNTKARGGTNSPSPTGGCAAVPVPPLSTEASSAQSLSFEYVPATSAAAEAGSLTHSRQLGSVPHTAAGGVGMRTPIVASARMSGGRGGSSFITEGGTDLARYGLRLAGPSGGSVSSARSPTAGVARVGSSIGGGGRHHHHHSQSGGSVINNTLNLQGVTHTISGPSSSHPHHLNGDAEGAEEEVGLGGGGSAQSYGADSRNSTDGPMRFQRRRGASGGGGSALSCSGSSSMPSTTLGGGGLVGGMCVTSLPTSPTNAHSLLLQAPLSLGGGVAAAGGYADIASIPLAYRMAFAQHQQPIVAAPPPPPLPFGPQSADGPPTLAVLGHPALRQQQQQQQQQQHNNSIIVPPSPRTAVGPPTTAHFSFLAAQPQHTQRGGGGGMTISSAPSVSLLPSFDGAGGGGGSVRERGNSYGPLQRSNDGQSAGSNYTATTASVSNVGGIGVSTLRSGGGGGGGWTSVVFPATNRHRLSANSSNSDHASSSALDTHRSSNNTSARTVPPPPPPPLTTPPPRALSGAGVAAGAAMAGDLNSAVSRPMDPHAAAPSFRPTARLFSVDDANIRMRRQGLHHSANNNNTIPILNNNNTHSQHTAATPPPPSTSAFHHQPHRGGSGGVGRLFAVDTASKTASPPPTDTTAAAPPSAPSPAPSPSTCISAPPAASAHPLAISRRRVGGASHSSPLRRDGHRGGGASPAATGTALVIGPTSPATHQRYQVHSQQQGGVGGFVSVIRAHSSDDAQGTAGLHPHPYRPQGTNEDSASHTNAPPSTASDGSTGAVGLAAMAGDRLGHPGIAAADASSPNAAVTTTLRFGGFGVIPLPPPQHLSSSPLAAKVAVPSPMRRSLSTTAAAAAAAGPHSFVTSEANCEDGAADGGVVVVVGTDDHSHNMGLVAPMSASTVSSGSPSPTRGGGGGRSAAGRIGTLFSLRSSHSTTTRGGDGDDMLMATIMNGGGVGGGGSATYMSQSTGFDAMGDGVGDSSALARRQFSPRLSLEPGLNSSGGNSNSNTNTLRGNGDLTALPRQLHPPALLTSTHSPTAHREGGARSGMASIINSSTRNASSSSHVLGPSSPRSVVGMSALRALRSDREGSPTAACLASGGTAGSDDDGLDSIDPLGGVPSATTRRHLENPDSSANSIHTASGRSVVVVVGGGGGVGKASAAESLLSVDVNEATAGPVHPDTVSVAGLGPHNGSATPSSPLIVVRSSPPPPPDIHTSLSLAAATTVAREVGGPLALLADPSESKRGSLIGLGGEALTLANGSPPISHHDVPRREHRAGQHDCDNDDADDDEEAHRSPSYTAGSLAGGDGASASGAHNTSTGAHPHRARPPSQHFSVGGAFSNAYTYTFRAGDGGDADVVSALSVPHSAVSISAEVESVATWGLGSPTAAARGAMMGAGKHSFVSAAGNATRHFAYGSPSGGGALPSSGVSLLTRGTHSGRSTNSGPAERVSTAPTSTTAMAAQHSTNDTTGFNNNTSTTNTIITATCNTSVISNPLSIHCEQQQCGIAAAVSPMVPQQPPHQRGGGGGALPAGGGGGSFNRLSHAKGLTPSPPSHEAAAAAIGGGSGVAGGLPPFAVMPPSPAVVAVLEGGVVGQHFLHHPSSPTRNLFARSGTSHDGGGGATAFPVAAATAAAGAATSGAKGHSRAPSSSQQHRLVARQQLTISIASSHNNNGPYDAQEADNSHQRNDETGTSSVASLAGLGAFTPLPINLSDDFTRLRRDYVRGGGGGDDALEAGLHRGHQALTSHNDYHQRDERPPSVSSPLSPPPRQQRQQPVEYGMAGGDGSVGSATDTNTASTTAGEMTLGGSSYNALDDRSVLDSVGLATASLASRGGYMQHYPTPRSHSTAPGGGGLFGGVLVDVRPSSHMHGWSSANSPDVTPGNMAASPPTTQPAANGPSPRGGGGTRGGAVAFGASPPQHSPTSPLGLAGGKASHTVVTGSHFRNRSPSRGTSTVGSSRGRQPAVSAADNDGHHPLTREGPNEYSIRNPPTGMGGMGMGTGKVMGGAMMGDASQMNTTTSYYFPAEQDADAAVRPLPSLPSVIVPPRHGNGIARAESHKGMASVGLAFGGIFQLPYNTASATNALPPPPLPLMGSAAVASIGQIVDTVSAGSGTGSSGGATGSLGGAAESTETAPAIAAQEGVVDGVAVMPSSSTNSRTVPAPFAVVPAPCVIASPNSATMQCLLGNCGL